MDNRSLKTYYNNLWDQAFEGFKTGQFEIDQLIESTEDTRYGLTLLARPSREVRKAISDILDQIKPAAPRQYYYPESDIHITVLSIISCTPDFSPDGINLPGYSRLIAPVAANAAPFHIRFEGITASSSCIMICGYPDNNQLNRIRDELRDKFKQTALLHSIDKRYRIHTAHTTVIRFKQQLGYPEAFLARLMELRNVFAGTCLIDELELVANDWYQKKEKVRPIATFKLSR